MNLKMRKTYNTEWKHILFQNGNHGTKRTLNLRTPSRGASLYFEPEHGFFYYKVFPGGVLYIDHFATDDYQYLFRRAREMARREHSEESFDVRWSNSRLPAMR